ncbi:RING finger and transmembrane domain-containing protein 2-like [Anneissia japonica]|uniref:RING finger and transmembrane domain-containing protein 2-like n=1 Tax=Anneissia japonica TaxID=1529436 RepID=UPI001425570D|nr:RING finger and transmembrane domain-containing protein 2-like [Anneissia japonica]
MAGLVEGGIGDNLNTVLRGIIPGLNTMDTPVHPSHSSDNRSPANDSTIIDISTDEGGGGDEGDTDQGGNGAGGGQTVPEMRGLRSILDRTILFILLLAVKILIDHRLGLFVVIGLVGTFFHHNGNLKQQVILKAKRKIFSLIIMLVFLLFNIFFVYYIFSDQHLYRSLIFCQPVYETMDFWMLLWIVGITDFMIKYMTIAVKGIVTILPRRCLSFKRRGKIYLLIEQFSQMYRTLTPMPIWIQYLSNDPETHWSINYGLVLLYVIFKAGSLIDKLKEVRAATKGICFDVQYGVHLSKGEPPVNGQACPICQDDYTDPIQLQCKHIFCDECVSLWFDRERTCPMCRAKVADDPTWRDGNTSLYVHLF